MSLIVGRDLSQRLSESERRRAALRGGLAPAHRQRIKRRPEGLNLPLLLGRWPGKADWVNFRTRMRQRMRISGECGAQASSAGAPLRAGLFLIALMALATPAAAQ